MTTERWQQTEDIYQTAVYLPEDQREEYLAAVCAGDDELRTTVGTLLTRHAQAGEFTETLPLTADLLTGDPLIERRVGAYRIVREIGRGGMGAVYLGARADNEFQKRVAVKLIKRGMDTDFILRRFRRERQILASLDHPHIARLLDGGTTEDGLPYFVMEYIEGQPLYRHCDARRLGIAERLHLFQQICDAVHFAHQNLVVHRDIKPSNILVTPDGAPHLLDFGIAKLLTPELAADTIDATGTAARLMTPEYASPEQVRGERARPTSDIYSLGTVLYELLTGHRPLRLRSRSMYEIARVVCEEEPELPSESLMRTDNLVLIGAGDAATLEAICQARGASPESLRRELAGDLDRIALKALRKDPRQRYQSAAELREDITRHLEGRPVSAPLYLPDPLADPLATRPFASRGSSEQSTGATTVAILPLKLLTVSPQEDTGDKYLSIGLADALITRLSNIHSLTVRPTSSVLRYGDETVDPLDAGRELNVDFVLDGRIKRAGERIRISLQLLDVRLGASAWAQQFDERFTDALSLEDAITAQVAEALVPHLTGEERRQLKKRGTDDPEAFEAYLRGRYHLNTFTEEGFAKAIVAYHQAVSIDPHYALPYAGIADYYNWLGVYGVMPPNECYRAAIQAAVKAIELNSELSEAYAALGFAVLVGNYDWARGEEACRRAIELNPHNAQAHVWYSLQLTMEGRFDEGIAHAKRGIELDPLTPFNAHNLGWCLYFARRFDESIAQFRRVIAAHPLYPLAHYGLSWMLRYLGQHQEALGEAKRSVELSNESPMILFLYGQAQAAAGLRREAEEMVARLTALAAERQVSFYNVALIHCFLGEREKAFECLERAYAERDAWLVWLGVEPMFDSMRDDPHFRALLQKTNNPAAAPAEIAGPYF
ncbi:MAG: protein kinase domain-containing protein [Blastocatellia bacterium]